MTITVPTGVATERPLTDLSLASLAGSVDLPGYERAALTPAVVHLGVGGSHRAHQAVYLDDLARTGNTAWGVTGVGLRSTTIRDALTPQDWLFTVVERGRHGDRARVVGSLIGYRYAPDDPHAVLELLADRRTRLVTLTITGAGYHVDAAGRFRGDDPEVRADLARPAAPTTAAGYLVEALDRRRRDLLQARALAGGTDPRPLLALRDVFGGLGDDAEVVTALECALHDLEVYGPAATMRDYLAT